MNAITSRKNEFEISTNKERLNIDAIHTFLSTEAYWSRGIPKETVLKSVENALCFGIYHHNKQVGFARVISDFATIAYLGDLYITQEYRGRGLSKWLMETIMQHPCLQGLRRWVLLTSDAHELYRQFGWTNIADPSKWMELHNKTLYKLPASK